MLVSQCKSVVQATCLKLTTAVVCREETGATVVVEKLDLASLQSVRTCAQKLIDTEDKIDILINNAGQYQLILVGSGWLRELSVSTNDPFVWDIIVGKPVRFCHYWPW